MIRTLGDREPVLEGSGHFVADTATVIGHVRLKSRASVWFGSVLRGDNEWIEIGDGSNVQDNCVLHTDDGYPLVIGRGVTVGHMVMLHGCTIADDCLIGIGSTIMNGANIGKNSIVGAHALITENKSFPAGSLIVGVPAQAVREVTAAELDSIRQSAEHYVANADRYRAELRA